MTYHLYGVSPADKWAVDWFVLLDFDNFDLDRGHWNITIRHVVSIETMCLE